MGSTYKNAIINIGLASFPVKLICAARDDSKGFNQVHLHDDGSVTQTKQQNFCPGCNTVVPFENLAKGISDGNGNFVVVTAEELEAITPKSAKEINIDEVVFVAEINPIFFDKSYYLVPNVKENTRAEIIYQSLVESLRNTGKAGTGTMADRGKVYNICIRLSDNGLMLHTMFTSQEIREFPEYYNVRKVESNPQYVQMITEIIGRATVPFDPKNVNSAYDTQKAELIQQKLNANNPMFSSGNKTTTASTDPFLAMLTASLHKVTADNKPTGEQQQSTKKTSSPKKATK